ncbi:crossover junction endodeoxyribonuclease NDAI_0B06130 [Naumovozyma dairenensis CBS 421]|uniref:XPG-I domain-containing protein n=1 Tax=Naumovozyma dairenensis (strain ATCC 10597 / BCRC 20456 / CBS 421 / NBRC 0211 / NRRL Y-12639) TaxID=1071378 RepID=G0W784_NAUDC|nr:hypothetical protein NDAI_0B06130 [Naumovozyma dairenensis CBS 421]CCD23645.1 hypothetical protein NDAI_0B06130 [Naumovozyma dairenensis CBS 421]
MGVPQLWEILKPYTEANRISLRQFISNFEKENGRSPKVAIDGYNWLFECGFIVSPTNSIKYSTQGTTPKAMLNLLVRLKELLSLNVGFILVFDGAMKPSFKNKFNTSSSGNDMSSHNNIDMEMDMDMDQISMEGYLKKWQDHIEYHKINNGCPLSNNNDEFMKNVKQLLKFMNISYIDACGEGEAQCAWLQVHGYVDFVWTNDSDIFIFGGTKVIKNYSKFVNDIGMTASPKKVSSPLRKAKEYFITVIDLNEVIRKTNGKINQWSLLFFSVLLGADYNKGVKGLGKTKALQLSQLEYPNFSNQFHEIFQNLDDNTEERILAYTVFRDNVFQYCKAHSVELFGRNYSVLLSEDSFQGWPTEVVIMNYFHPILIPDFNDSIFDKKYINNSQDLNYDLINFVGLMDFLKKLNLPNITNFDRWYHDLIHECFLLRYILSIDPGNSPSNMVKIPEEREMTTGNDENEYENSKIKCYKVRYKSFLKGIPDMVQTDGYSSPGKSPIRQPRSPSKRQLDVKEFPNCMWIPIELIPKKNPIVVEFIHKEQEEEKRKVQAPTSRRRRKIKTSYSQKNTLDGFLNLHASPVKKNANTLDDIHKMEATHTLEPVKRRLFVEEEDNDVNENTPRPTDESQHEGDSLVILEENILPSSSTGTEVLDRSPYKRIWDYNNIVNICDDDDYKEGKEGDSSYKYDIDNSPIKKQRLPSEKSKETSSTSQLDMNKSTPDSLFNNRPVLENTPDTLKRTPSILDQLVLDAETAFDHLQTEESDLSYSSGSLDS